LHKIPVYLLIPFQNGLIREFKLPWMKKTEREAAVHYYLRHEIPFLIDDFFYDYQLWEAKAKDFLYGRVVAARKEVVVNYANCLKQAGCLLRGIEYSVLAFGEVLETEGGIRMAIQGVNENRIQLVLYQNKQPEIIREIDLSQSDPAKYQIYLAFKDYPVPLDYVLSDQSPQAEAVVNILIEGGFVREQKRTVRYLEQGKKTAEDHRFQELALIGEMQRVSKKKNMNVYRPILRPIKVKTLVSVASLMLCVLLLLMGIVWYPAVTDFHRLQSEVSLLQDQIKQAQSQEEQAMWMDWQDQTDKSAADIQKVREIMELVEEEVNLTRLDYKQGVLILWIECSDNLAAVQLIGNLTAEGWKNPLLYDYKYQNAKISFCLRVES
jgi:type IV pilus assembly protein PilM